MHAATKAAILGSGLLDPATRLRDINMLAEMVAYGDSGAFTDKVCALCCAWEVCQRVCGGWGCVDLPGCVNCQGVVVSTRVSGGWDWIGPRPLNSPAVA